MKKKNFGEKKNSKKIKKLFLKVTFNCVKKTCLYLGLPSNTPPQKGVMFNAFFRYNYVFERKPLKRANPRSWKNRLLYEKNFPKLTPRFSNSSKYRRTVVEWKAKNNFRKVCLTGFLNKKKTKKYKKRQNKNKSIYFL